MLSEMAKKTVAVFSILLLIIGLLPIANADLYPDPPDEDGVVYDTFDLINDVTLTNCTNESGSILLKNESINTTYDCSKTPDKIEGWVYTWTLMNPSEEGLLGVLGMFTNPESIPKSEQLYTSDYNGLKEENDNLSLKTTTKKEWRYGGLCYPAMHRFKFQINQTKNLVENLRIFWKSGEFNGSEEVDNLKDITMYMWNYKPIIPRWEFIGNTSESKGSIFGNESEDFISDEGEIEILIVGAPVKSAEDYTCTLYSDYISIILSTKEGHLPEGTAISSVIQPSAGFSGWESIIWEGTKPTNTCYIKLQVLDNNTNDNIILTLDGNSEGFTDSPIDLSSLGSSYTKIKLKATLYSTNLQFTPYLYSWAVLWHTYNGFHDSFVYDFRISKAYSIQMESGEIKISNYSTNWPIFGKDPANTRAYVGPEAGVGSNKTYWFTDSDINIGGWFRSPIMNNGRVYISSNDTKIYAFNLTANSIGDPQPPVAVSDAKYKVETAIAADDNIVIVATSKLNDENNKIYALNSTDLSEIWSYPTDAYDDTICFSVSPTISDGKVFVTSWSGKFYNTPIISYILNKLNSILRYRLGLNNKLIALDVNSGIPLWDPINLPAGSLSTPAVANGLIFVGCENPQGSSLSAFNENTGEAVWNASVGAIGRSSPVLIESDAGKVLIVVSREQSILSYKGTDKIVALNAETGEMIWNKTIGNQSSILRATLLKSLFGFEHTMGISPVVATPAAFGDDVFVMSSDGKLYALNVNSGEEKWMFDATKESTSSLYFTASPIVVDNNVYVTSTEGYIYILDISNGQLVRSINPFEYSEYAEPKPTNTYASPIITNGLILLSVIESDPYELTTVGRVFCIGNYTNNSYGKIYSVPFHVQKGRWWSSFNTYNTSYSENTVNFSILDGNGNILKTGLNGNNNDISDLRSGVIQLCAELKILNESQALPILYGWDVYWNNTETVSPDFVESSFKPDPSGWIKNNTPVCTINVYDATSGLDVNSARFRITYTSNQVSDWYVADCTGENGSKVNETVTADISKLNLDPNASDLKSIEFYIKDLAGNKGTFDLGKNFSIDRLPPTSYIVNTFSDDCYNESVEIEANGTDPGAENNRSGIKTIALYYRLKGEESWTQYSSEESPFKWLFEKDTSGIYEVRTIATDKAGNVEESPGEPGVFTYDDNDPYKPEFDEDPYEFNTIPEFAGKDTIKFKDDYILKKVEYKLHKQDFQSNWTVIKDDINSDTYEEEWSLTNDEWIEMDDGIYYLYFRLTDNCGNQYITPSNEEALVLEIDTIPPGSNVSLDLSDLEGGGWKDTYTITAEVPEDESIHGVTLEYSYSSDNSEWSEWTQYGDELSERPYTWEFKSEEGSGYYRFKAKIWDAAGNSKESAIQEMSLTQFPTALLALMIILFVVLLVVTILLVKKIRKKR